jgi:hypothetical protein
MYDRYPPNGDIRGGILLRPLYVDSCRSRASLGKAGIRLYETFLAHAEMDASLKLHAGLRQRDSVDRRTNR